MRLSEVEIGLAVLEYHFQCLSARVDVPCLEEIRGYVRGEKSIPFDMLDAHIRNVFTDASPKTDIITFEFAVIFLQIELFMPFYP
jgi:hypothetical protein